MCSRNCRPGVVLLGVRATTVVPMPAIPSFLRPVSAINGLVAQLRAWPVAAQQHARRNAMIAATACAQRRAEREDVADYLNRVSPRREQTSSALSEKHPASR